MPTLVPDLGLLGFTAKVKIGVQPLFVCLDLIPDLERDSLGGVA
jgi:hypothetical protein